MADESLHLPAEQNNIDFHIVTLFERLESMRKENAFSLLQSNGARFSSIHQPKRSMQAEIRTLEFWRSIISECLASFFYVFIVCGAAAGAGVGASVSSVLLATALASGFAVTTLTQCFMHISGAHINPAVTLATCAIRAITPLRAAMYITAQCGGGIAGAALLYGVTVPGYQGNLQAAISHSSTLAAWERFGVEFILTFIVVLTYFVSMDSCRRIFGHSALTIGAAYGACSFVSMPYLNPARSLGPSFVLNKWDNHWVYWFGPLVGGVVSGIVFKYIFNSKRSHSKSKDNVENDSSSDHSDEDLNYDLDLEKPNMQNQKFPNSTYRSAVGNLSGHPNSNGNATVTGSAAPGSQYCQNLYTTAPLALSKFEPEPLYGGTRSLYCRSPPLTRANLNRSQSVYAKSNTAINRDLVPRPGPLVPAQSLYPIRLTQTQSSHLQNQNVQNQLQQRTESIYGIRGSTRQSAASQPPPPQSHINSSQSQQQQQQQQQQQIHQQQQQQQHHHQQQQFHQHQQHQQQQHQLQEAQGFQPIYGSRHNPNPTDGGLKYEHRTLDSRDEVIKYSRNNRPESVYGMTGGNNGTTGGSTNSHQRSRGQSAQSDDSSYGSFHGSAITPPARNPNTENLIYAPNGVMPPQIRIQPERKISNNGTTSGNSVTIGGSGNGASNERQQTPSVTYSSKPSPQQQHNTQGQQQQAMQSHPPYGMMSVRQN